MLKLTYSIDIAADAGKIWRVLFEKHSYEQWASPFAEGSTYTGTMAQGERIKFHNGTYEGMYADVERLSAEEYVEFRHIGMLGKNGEELPLDEEAKKWSGALETYRLTKSVKGVLLEVTVDSDESFVEYMNETFPRALEIVRSLSEQQS